MSLKLKKEDIVFDMEELLDLEKKRKNGMLVASTSVIVRKP
jgi:hypothetical protein